MHNNPVNFVDPTGHAEAPGAIDARGDSGDTVSQIIPMDDGSKLVVHQDGSIWIIDKDGNGYSDYTVAPQSAARVVAGYIVEKGISLGVAGATTAFTGGASNLVKGIIGITTDVSTDWLTDVDRPGFGEIRVYIYGDVTYEPGYVNREDGSSYMLSCSKVQAVHQVRLYADGSYRDYGWTENRSSAGDSLCQ